MRNHLASFFDVPNNIALSEAEFLSQLTAEMFTRQFAAMTARIDRDDIDTVRYTTDFLQTSTQAFYGYTGEPGEPILTSSEEWGVGWVVGWGVAWGAATSGPPHPASS
uniref:Acyl-CoA dehydrogenase n=1 Tax=Globodera pallida TaxID=36090 RepID=A0A183CLC7_GLOPA